LQPLFDKIVWQARKQLPKSEVFGLKAMSVILDNPHTDGMIANFSSKPNLLVPIPSHENLANDEIGILWPAKLIGVVLPEKWPQDFADRHARRNCTRGLIVRQGEVPPVFWTGG
jgi:hypothetical protein